LGAASIDSITPQSDATLLPVNNGSRGIGVHLYAETRGLARFMHRAAW
jgi:hypothetical protein